MFTVPADDRRLRVASGPWKRKRAAAAYDGTFSQVRNRKGATLTYAVTGARSLALVVGTGPGHGSVKVFLGNKLLRTVSLAGSPRYRKVVTLASFANPRSGTVRHRHEPTAKLVRIDGLGVAT